jgi:hypothetical protein
VKLGELLVGDRAAAKNAIFPDIDCTETFRFGSSGEDTITISGLQLGLATELQPARNVIVGGTGRFRDVRGEAKTWVIGEYIPQKICSIQFKLSNVGTTDDNAKFFTHFDLE